MVGSTGKNQFGLFSVVPLREGGVVVSPRKISPDNSAVGWFPVSAKLSCFALSMSGGERSEHVSVIVCSIIILLKCNKQNSHIS